MADDVTSTKDVSSDEDDLTPPVVNNVIVPRTKSANNPTSENSNGNSPVVSSREQSKIKPVTSATKKTPAKVAPAPEKVKVIVRCRPISKKELEQGHVS